MAKERLEEYPKVSSYADSDFQAQMDLLPNRRACVNYGIGEKTLSSGERVVYMLQQIEGDELVFDKGKYIGIKCEQGVIICGYKVWPKWIWLFTGPKIREIPEEERKRVESELIEKLNVLGKDIGKKINYVGWEY